MSYISKKLVKMLNRAQEIVRNIITHERTKTNKKLLEILT